jgi:hypothetical protein
LLPFGFLVVMRAVLESIKLALVVSKRQTHREVGTQSYGSARLMRTDWQTARPPKFFVLGGFCFKKEVHGLTLPNTN